MASHEVFEEVSSQETFKGERSFERVQSQKTFEETTPQDMYMDLQHESEIFISDLEILNDGASFQETFKGKGIFKELSFQETFIRREHAARYETSTEMMPQDLYMELHESKIFIPDLENLDDEKYLPKVIVNLIYNGIVMIIEMILEVTFCGYILLIESIIFTG
ncbi:8577_t:CDS:2 [Cetraspora pellucida]|uniref:8577_t:CDS:1 n=1 Tax=Cetraspora pellucida TaxID=1433469 RepID=A0ACA9JZR7_9GLOM|nr:8577_t:CDS:2 [Cetraspora pellucida]